MIGSASMFASLRRASRWPRNAADVLRAGTALRRAMSEVRDAPTGALLTFDASTAVGRPREATSYPNRSEAHHAHRWARAVRRAQLFGWWRCACLARSIALHRLLEARGVPGSHVCVGVKYAAAFEAHAWVELGDWVVGDRADVVDQWVHLADVRSPSSTVLRRA